MTKKYEWLNKDSRTFLKRDYLPKDQSPEERLAVIANAAENILKIDGFAEKFDGYMAKGFYSLSTPIWLNFGNERGCPISCFNSHVSDSVESFLLKQAEVGMMTKIGGGTSGYFGAIRGRGTPISTGGEAEGAVRAMELFYHVTNIVSQGAARRGHFAAYLPIDHPDVEEFLKIRSEGATIQEMSFGVCVSDEWMHSMIGGDRAKRTLWGKVLQRRSESGYPYIFFTDNANNQKPQVYKDKGYMINSSNMCSEIFLPSTDDESFVCNLSSMNLAKYDEWKDTDAVETLIYFLDAVMTEFIDKTENYVLMAAPRKFAIRHRALGLGVLGWHDLLQSKMIAFESMEAKALNSEVWDLIRLKTDSATEELAKLFGEPEVLKGYGRRNTTTIAVAPTTSSSFILGQVSPSIEPLNSNYFVKNLAKGNFTYINHNLKKLLRDKQQDTDETWHSILVHGGSVQHLDFLTEHEKNVFKTFEEISQKEVIIQAIQRQKRIDQGQSLNTLFPSNTKPKDINAIIIFAWENGVKSLYYQRATNPSQQLARNITNCTSCEG